MEVCNSIDDVQSIKRKKVKGDALINLLNEMQPFNDESEDVFPPRMRQRLIDGYNSYIQANEAYASKDYESALELYEEAIQNGRKPAMALQEAREKYYATTSSSSAAVIEEGFHPSLNWLVTTFKNCCRARLLLGDIDGARRDAFASTVFSQNKDADSHECLAMVCQASGDVMGEYQAVKAAMEQYALVEERCSRPMSGMDAVGRAEAAMERRNAEMRKGELGFRLGTLERELKRT